MFEFFSKGAAGLKQDEKQKNESSRNGEGASRPAAGVEERLPPLPHSERDFTAEIAEEYRPQPQAGSSVLGFDPPKAKNALPPNREWPAGPPFRYYRNLSHSPEKPLSEAELLNRADKILSTRSFLPENRKGASAGIVSLPKASGRPYAFRPAGPNGPAAQNPGPKSPKEAEHASPLPLFARISELEHALKTEKRLHFAGAERLARCEEQLKLQTAKLEESLKEREESQALQEEASATITELRDELCRMRAAFEDLPKTGDDKLGLAAQLAICRAGAEHSRAQLSRLSTENKELSSLVSTQRKTLGLQKKKTLECLGGIASLSTHIAELLLNRMEEEKKLILDWQKSAAFAVSEAKAYLDCD